MLSPAAMMIAALLWSAAAPANPLADAERGLVQCYRPDTRNKTCHSTAAYRRIGDGSYDNRAVVPLSRDATLETHTLVTLRDGAVCGTIREADARAGIVRVGGEALPAEKASPILAQVANALAPIIGKEICTRYEVVDGALTARATLPGPPETKVEEPVLWIDAEAGYRVVP